MSFDQNTEARTSSVPLIAEQGADDDANDWKWLYHKRFTIQWLTDLYDLNKSAIGSQVASVDSSHFDLDKLRIDVNSWELKS